MVKWRFDQGRLDYFQYDALKEIAVALASLDGVPKPGAGQTDIVRTTLGRHSALPFDPPHYFVWRNYGRVFECMLLATSTKNVILATDLCQEIAANPDDIDSDDYFAFFVRSFYHPSPVFDGYDPTAEQVFPGVAIIKFLISESIVKGKNYVTLDEIAQFLIGNSVTGLESLADYGRLRKKRISLSDVEMRQLREFIRFISQISFLKWENPKLFIEAASHEELLSIESSLTPILNVRKQNPSQEILQMGSNFRGGTLRAVTKVQVDTLDDEFVEGKKVRVTHLRTERSAKLKSFYFEKATNPSVCRMCSLDTHKRYPWSKHVIELHHLLPLSSPVRVEKTHTSIRDLVGLCPSCHRATHRFYSSWFRETGVKDFRNYDEAVAVYEAAKSRVII